MFNLIKAEFYKYTRRPYLYIVSIIILIMSVSLPLIFSVFNETFGDVTRYDLIQMYNSLVQFIPYSVLIFTSVFHEEYTEKTLKNLLPWDTPKWKVYIGKYIVQIIFASILGIILAIGLLSSMTILPKGTLYTNSLSLDLLYRLLAFFPTVVAGIGIINLFVIFIKNEAISYLLYYFCVQNIPMYLTLAQSLLPDFINTNKKYILGVSLQSLYQCYPLSSDINFNILIGLLYTIAFIFINIYIFKNKETL